MQLRLRGRDTLRSEINVIPMIDVLLVLIVIFMLLQGRFVLDVQHDVAPRMELTACRHKGTSIPCRTPRASVHSAPAARSS